MENGENLSPKFPEFPLPAYRGLRQVISLPLADGQCVEDIVASTVRIMPARSQQETASSMLTLRSEVDYAWDDRYHAGRLVSVHKSGTLLAYALSADRQTHNGAVRITNKTGSRTLVKGMKGPVQDLAFAYHEKEVLLAVVDELGNLFVYEVVNESSGLAPILKLHVAHDEKPRNDCSHRVQWVPYLPEEDTEDSDTTLLALLIGTKVEVWSVAQVSNSHGPGPLQTAQVKEGVLVIDDHSDVVMDAVFSPDGSALATASLDGSMQFFQIYMHEKPKCLHNWLPHDGQPLSFLAFLDNHKEIQLDSQFWKFVVTAAKNNTELKVWNCTKWTHIQTISMMNESRQTRLKAALDLSASFLILSDQSNEVVYLFKVLVADKFACLESVAAYLVPFSIISFAVVDVTSTVLTPIDSEDIEDFEDDDDDHHIEVSTSVSMYLMHPKSLQDCKIQWLPPKAGGQLVHSTLGPDQPELPLPITLMTPKEFSSPAKPEVNDNVEVLVTKNDLAASGASSPSQEVQDILNQQEVNELTRLYNSQDEVKVKVKEEPPSPAPSAEWPHLSHMPPMSNSVIPRNNNKRGRHRNRKQKEQRDAIFIQSVLSQKEKVVEKESKRESLSKRETRVEEIPAAANSNQVQPATLSDVAQKLDTVLAALHKQEAQIEALQLRLSQQEPSTSQHVELLLNNHLKAQVELRETSERDRQENLLFALSQAVENMISAKLEEVVPTEFRKNVVPVIMSDMQPFKENLHLEMTQQLSATDQLLKENISKLVHSKSVMDVLAKSATTSMRTNLAETCKELMINFFIPRLEKVLEKTFQQIHETFTSGTRECVGQLREELDKVKGDLKRAENKLKEEADANKSSSLLLHSEMEKRLISVGDILKKHLTDTIKKELRSLDSTAVSRAVTPACQPHEKTSVIAQFMATGQYNQAFKEALSASDLNIVMFTCEKISAEQLFARSPTCPLEQPVLLSLIQQLTADLTTKMELKCSYLTEAVLRLELHHPTTKEHLPVMIKDVERNISNYLATHPPSKSTAELNRILMVLKILLAGKVDPCA